MRLRISRRWGLPVLPLMLLTAVVSAQAQDSQILPVLREFCFDCHGTEEPEANLDLQSLSYDLQDEAVFASWERIFERIETREMPPPDSGEIPATRQEAFLTELGKVLESAHYRSKETVLRRLNRREYTNTMNDLFGTDLRLDELFPEDSRAHEFDNVGSALSLSMVHMQRYIEAADQVIEAAIAKTTEAPTPNRITTNYAETREGEKHIGSAWGQAPDGSVVFFRKLGYPTGMLRTANAREAGYYRIRVTGYAYQSDKPITFAVGGTTFQRGASQPTFGYFSFEPGEPQSIELEAWMDARYMVQITPWGISDDDYLIKKNGIEAYRGPGLAIKEVELEGPLVDEFPTRGHQLLFQDFEFSEIEPANPSHKQKSWYQPKFELLSEDPGQAARKTLHRIASVAFRRPVESAELQAYYDLFESEFKSTSDSMLALKTSVAALFCSTDFLFLSEEAINEYRQLDEYALASRLSYFLARTTPDEELLALAKANTLTTNLAQQTNRLLKDERFERFVRDFADAWLNLREIEFTTPDKDLFPEFDPFLQFSMLGETRQFLRGAIQENVPVRELVQSDYAYLNNRLAQLYEIPGVEGPEIRKVTLPAGSVRGGLLGQACIHKVTANGTNTSPVVRGVWVAERLLGLKIPPPPPGVAGVEPDIRGATTLRELLDKHRDADNCRACHAVLDPPGFALESFSPIGAWRDRFRSMGEGEKVDLVIDARKVRYRLGQPVDASGQLTDGETFDGFLQFRELIAERDEELARSLAQKFLTFGTGRELGFSDRKIIDRIVAKAAPEFRVADLLHACVQSEIFRTK